LECKFNNHPQESTESIDVHVTSLRALAETREFGSLKDNLDLDRIVCRVQDNSAVRRKLLQESDLTLAKCVDMCRVIDATAEQLKDMAPSQTSARKVNLPKKEKKRKTPAAKESSKSPQSPLLFEWTFCGRQQERKRDKRPDRMSSSGE